MRRYFEFLKVSTSHIDMFEFMGRLLGKALYESTLVEPVFASFFLNKLLDRPNYVDGKQTHIISHTAFCNHFYIFSFFFFLTQLLFFYYIN